MTSLFKNIHLVVSEHGAEADSWVRSWESGDRPVLHLAQQPAESSSVFADRVREAVDALAEANRIPAEAVVLTRSGADADTLLSRFFTLRVVLNTMVRQGGGMVSLVGEYGDRLPLLSLANTAQTMVRGTGVMVQVATQDELLAAA